MRLNTALLVGLLVATGWVCTGCSKETNKSVTQDLENPSHMPTSLGDLCGKMKARLRKIKNGQSSERIESELTDLVSWTPEFAADTNIGETVWIPIYESSERVRSLIEEQISPWDDSLITSINQLYQLSEDAWMTLDPAQRTQRYQTHQHRHHDHSSHDHDHGHHDHGHHDHADHDHGGHDHSHDTEHDHDHSHPTGHEPGDKDHTRYDESKHEHAGHDHGGHDHTDHGAKHAEQPPMTTVN